MNSLQQQLVEQLKRNLFIKESLRAEIVRKLPTLSPAQTERIHALLVEANQNQDETLKSILEREPYFFHRIEATILHTMSAEFDRLSAEEIKTAENQLIQDLANYQS